jgi:AcrR family transcriptional regulator
MTTRDTPQAEVASGARALRAAATRERILDAAAELFYEEGIRAVSADRVIAQVAINKGTFYRYFPTKDDLVVAYLERRSVRERAAAEAILEASDGDPAAAFGVMAAAAGEETCTPGFRGCPFINAAAEYADPTHPVRQAVDAHRTWFKHMIEGQLEHLEVSDVERVADALILLRDGAMVSGYLSDPAAVGPTLARAIQDVLARATP